MLPSTELAGQSTFAPRDRPRVLLVASQTRFSMRPYVVETCRALSAYADVSLLVVDPIDQPDLKFRQVTVGSPGSSRLSKLRHLLSPRTVLRLRRLVREGGFGLVHILNGEGYPYSLVLASAASKARIPLVVTVHDPVAHIGSTIDKANEVLARWTLRHVTVVHVHKAYQSRLIERRCGRPVRTSVIAHADMADTYLRLRRGLPRRGHVLFFGRIEAYKGLDTLLDAMELLPNGLQLTIAGPGQLTSIQAQKIAALGRRIRLENRYLDDQEVADLLEQAGTLALPYTQVTQSALPAIGRAFGLKVVSSDLPGFRDEVLPPYGWRFEAGSPRSLADALLAATHSTTPVEPLRRSTITFDESASQLSELYRSVMHAG